MKLSKKLFLLLLLTNIVIQSGFTEEEEDNKKECSVTISGCNLPSGATAEKAYENNKKFPITDGSFSCACEKNGKATADVASIGGGPSHYTGTVTWSASCDGDSKTKTKDYKFWVYKINTFDIQKEKVIKNGDAELTITDFLVTCSPSAFKSKLSVKTDGNSLSNQNILAETKNAQLMLDDEEIAQTTYEVLNKNYILETDFKFKTGNQVLVGHEVLTGDTKNRYLTVTYSLDHYRQITYEPLSSIFAFGPDGSFSWSSVKGKTSSYTITKGSEIGLKLEYCDVKVSGSYTTSSSNQLSSSRHVGLTASKDIEKKIYLKQEVETHFYQGTRRDILDNFFGYDRSTPVQEWMHGYKFNCDYKLTHRRTK